MARVASAAPHGREPAALGRGRVLGGGVPRRDRRGGARAARARTRRGIARRWRPASARSPCPSEFGGLGLSKGHDAAFKELEARVRGSPRPRGHLGHEQADRPDDRGVRHAGAAGAVVPELLPARRVLLPAVLRAGRRQRPRRTRVQGRARRRRVGARRAEGLDVDGAHLPSTGSPSAGPTRRPQARRADGVHRARSTPTASRSARSSRCPAGRRSTRCSCTRRPGRRRHAHRRRRRTAGRSPSRCSATSGRRRDRAAAAAGTTSW